MDFSFKGLLKKQGFTLVEMLVSIAVFTFMMGITVSYFAIAERNDLLRFSARRLADSLQSAMNFAQSGTLAQFPTAQSYGIHTDLAAQNILLFADTDASTGVGHWDINADALMREALSYSIRKDGDVVLSKITLTHEIAGVEQTSEITSLDIAALPPRAQLIFNSALDRTGSTITIGNVESASFILTQTKTGKTSQVQVFPLSGRIDVDY